MQGNGKHLAVSEVFYSIQGEGPTMGVPAIFVRLSNCNLLCGGKDSLKKNVPHDGATWRCDTIEVWSKGSKMSAEELWEQFALDDFPAMLQQQTAHLVITGGEPLLQQTQLVCFLRIAAGQLVYPYTELETNGTIVISDELMPLISQINCSPKLSNSGMPSRLRLKPQAILRIKKHPKAFFKFVISEAQDLYEVEHDWIEEFDLNPKQIYLMPAADNAKSLRSVSLFVAEAAKETGYRFSSRLQVAIWDKTTGV